MKVTVWTLASDDDNGTQAAVFATEAEAEAARAEAVFTDEEDKEHYFNLLASDEDAAADYREKYLEGSLDTYSIESHTLDVEPEPDPAGEHIKRAVALQGVASNMSIIEALEATK